MEQKQQKNYMKKQKKNAWLHKICVEKRKKQKKKRKTKGKKEKYRKKQKRKNTKMYNTSAITLHYSYGQSARTFDPSNIPNPHKCIVFSSHDTKTELKAFYTPISRDTTLDDSTEIDSVHYKKKKKKGKRGKKAKKRRKKH